MADFFPANCVFLICENQGGESSVLDVAKGSGGGIKNACADGQFDVAGVEGSTEGVDEVGLVYSPGQLR
jgi:hypothetical protein